MTTIAYRANVIAGDTQVSVNDNSVGKMNKVGQTGNILFGCAGACYLIQNFHRWAMAGCDMEKLPNMGDEKRGFATGMVVKDGEILVLTASGMCVIDCEYYALGSGTDLALGAMAHGASAVEAVEAAIKHDMNSSGEVTRLTAP